MSERSGPIRPLAPFVLAGGLAAAACGGNAPPPEPLPRLVRFTEISMGGTARVRRFAGVAKAPEEPRLSFKVSGTLITLAVKVGERVERGELIAEVDATDYQINLEDAQAGLRRAQAEARNASATFGRTRDLYEHGNASRTDYDAARAASESARAAVESAQQRLELARRQLGYTRLTAPAAGAIAAVDVSLNENVQPGQPIVMLVESGGLLEVRVTIPESLIASLRRGQPAVVRFDALPDTELAATVTEVGVAATGAGTTFPATVRLDEMDPAVRAGMAAEVGFRFEGTAAATRLRLPAHCVGEDAAGRFVWVLETAGGDRAVAHRRGVEVGELSREGIEILSGLEDGDRVVTAGVSQLRDGETVRVGASPEAA